MIKIASLLLASAVMLVSCEKQGGDDVDMKEKLYVTSDRNVIRSDGEDAAVFTAVIGGKDVTSETVFYLKKDMTQLSGNRLTVTSVGLHEVIAMYGTFYTEDPVVVTAIDMAIPAVAKDDEPGNTSFVHRAFLNQFTGTACGYCPGMVRALRAAFEDEETKEKTVLAAIHSYAAGDPAYITSCPKAAGYPYLQIDMATSFSYDQDPYAESGLLKRIVEERTASPAKVGISANPVLEGDVLAVTVEVKAAYEGEYNLGVWFMQDNVYGQQADKLGIVAGDNTFNYHHNCVRVCDSRYLNSYVGYPLGKIKVGETASRTFVLTIDKTAWKLKDMNDIHFAAFVTSTTADGQYYEVVNAVDCPYNEPVPYEYSK